MKFELIAAGTLLAAFISAPVFADDMEKMTKAKAKAEYGQAMNRAEADWKSVKAGCAVQAGTDKEKAVCVEDANKAYQTAKAQAKAARAATVAGAEADNEVREAQYDVAKASCAGMAGDAKDACIAEARWKYAQ